MSTSLPIPTPKTFPQPIIHVHFLGIIHGEFLKITRLFWFMLVVLAAGFLGGFFLGSIQPAVKTDLQHTPLHFLYYSMESNLVIFRILSGIFLLILTSFSIGYEYQYGTIRILLARGAGRVQLLLAKLTMLGLIALILLLVFTLLTILLTCVVMIALSGNLNALSTLTPAFWSNIGVDLLIVALNMAVTILLAAAMNALGRSLTFGLSASLLWFPVDNMGAPLMSVVAQVMHNNIWLQPTAYFLGPLLNRLPDLLLSRDAHSGFESFGTGPLVHVSSLHSLLVIGAYALIFLVAALIPTWKHDVKE